MTRERSILRTTAFMKRHIAVASINSAAGFGCALQAVDLNKDGRNYMKKTLIASLIAASFASPLAAQAADWWNTSPWGPTDVSPWLVRLRAVNIDPDSSSGAGGAARIPENAISVDNRWSPELDISYFFTKNIALELVLTYASHNVAVNAPGVYNGGVGNVQLLPPTLLVQYHFDWEGNPFKPYVGAGINFTWFASSDLSVPLFPGQLPLNVSNTSWGPALQIGADYRLTKNWYLNADFKYVWIDTKVTSSNLGAPLVSSTLDINPMIYGVGVGYRF
jgi:outer membrane protein